MSPTVAARLGWTLAALSIVGAGGGWLFYAWSTPTEDLTSPVSAGGNPLQYVTFPVIAVVGALIMSRRPANPVGWLMCLTGTLGALTTNGLGFGYIHYAVFSRGVGLPAVDGVAWLAMELDRVGFGLAQLMLLVFPTGRPPSPRWRPLVWGCITGTVLSVVGSATRPGPMDASIGTVALVITDNPTGLSFLRGGFADAIYDASQNLPVLALIGAIASVFFRLRDARGAERQQIKWFGYATALVGIATIGTIYSVWLPLVGFDPAQPPGWVPLLNGFWNLAVLALPVSICIAMLRYRLYDIDLIIRRTLVYGALTAFLALLYWTSVVFLQQVLRPLTQGSELAIVGSTLAVAALFQPLRHRIQQTVDRRFYRQRYDAVHTLAAFSARLRNEVDLDSLGAELLAVVGQTMQPQRLSLWLRPPTERRGS